MLVGGAKLEGMDYGAKIRTRQVGVLLGLKPGNWHPHQSEKMRPVAQRIRDHIVFALLVADNECVVLKVLHPPCVSIAQLLLRVEVFQGIIVREEHELLGLEVMAPVSQCLNDGIELLIVRGVPESNVI